MTFNEWHLLSAFIIGALASLAGVALWLTVGGRK